MRLIDNILSWAVAIIFFTCIGCIISFFITIFMEDIRKYRLNLIKNVFIICIFLLFIIGIISYYIL